MADTWGGYYYRGVSVSGELRSMMENEPVENGINLLKEIIKNSPVEIEAEYGKTKNDWLACFGSRIFQLESVFATSEMRSLFSEDEYQTVADRLEQLKGHQYTLKQEHSGREEPSEAERQQLLEELSMLV